jgi:D-3-phosphoglycerate dehydrogenase
LKRRIVEMRKYTCLNPIAEAGVSLFSGEYEKVDTMAEAQAVLVRSAAMHDLDLPDGLEAIARAGAGVNNIPLERCADKGIVVFNTPGANANGVKELVIAGMLLASRDIIGGVNWVQAERQNDDIAKLAEKQKKQFAGHEIQGKKLGIIGLGAIGILVANVAAHLGMEVYGYDPYISVDAAWKLSRNIKHIKDVNDIYKECDFITIHVPLMDSTRKMINEEAVEKMKEGVVLMNFARDVLVDEEAVVKALKEGKIRKYVSDFPNTTTAGEKDCIVIPHLGASTEESEENCAIMAVQELMDYLENGNIRNSVNYPNCDMGVCTSACRVAINHRNVKHMISQFTSIFGEADMNIANMVNKSKGDYAYSLFDLEQAMAPEVLAKLQGVEGVLRVRVIK